MAMGTERSKALHNFTMPCGLRWGNQRFLRCMKVNSDGQISALRRSSDHPIQQRRTTRERDNDSPLDFLHDSPKLGTTPPYPRRRDDSDADADADGGIAATREKVMLDLQTAADKMKDAIFKDGLDNGEVSAPPPQSAAAADAEGDSYCPWNLRTRRASSRTPVSGFISGKNGGPPIAAAAAACGGGNDVARHNSGSSQMRAVVAAAGPSQKSPMHRSDGNTAAAAASGEKRERAKLSVALSKRDIEEDFNAMVGHRPPRRPKKRARIIQKQLDTLFPGLWLTEVTPEMYKVIEATP